MTTASSCNRSSLSGLIAGDCQTLFVLWLSKAYSDQKRGVALSASCGTSDLRMCTSIIQSTSKADIALLLSPHLPHIRCV